MLLCWEPNGWYVVVGAHMYYFGPFRWNWLAELRGVVFVLFNI